MGSWGGEDLQQGIGWWTRRGGGLCNGAGQAAASRLHKMTARGPSEVADCGAGWAKPQLDGEAAAGAPGDRLHNPEFQIREIKP